MSAYFSIQRPSKANIRFSDNDGEHNSRVFAMRRQASARHDLLTQIDCAFYRIIYRDKFGQFDLEFPAQSEVYKINLRLAAPYAKQHNLARWAAIDATCHDAFVEWDAALARLAA